MASLRPTKRKRRKKIVRQKVCRLCENKVNFIDFKDVDLLRRYQTEAAKILPCRITGNCFRHQTLLATAIKRARILALVP
jgi:small subunit ribosomal protein S18